MWIKLLVLSQLVAFQSSFANDVAPTIFECTLSIDAFRPQSIDGIAMGHRLSIPMDQIRVDFAQINQQSEQERFKTFVLAGAPFDFRENLSNEDITSPLLKSSPIDYYQAIISTLQEVDLNKNEDEEDSYVNSISIELQQVQVEDISGISEPQIKVISSTTSIVVGSAIDEFIMNLNGVSVSCSIPFIL